MKSKLVVIAVVVVLGMLVFWLTRDVGPRVDSDRLAQLKRDAIARASESVSTGKSIEQWAAEGKAMPVPGDLMKAYVEEGRYWFVGKKQDGAGVEVPFEPGTLPRPNTDQPPARENPGYVGPDSCRQCHQKFYDSFIHTAHFRTTRWCEPSTVAGNFQPDQNVMNTSDPNVSFTMVRRDDELFQRVKFYDWEFEVPMQIITGSSKMAETYLYWHGDRLYQNNVTHLSDGDRWINSPGYINGDAAYARPVPPRCLDCHTTYFDVRSTPNQYTPDSMILGVTCERCHGPAQSHVDFHLANPDAQSPHAIVMPATLSRDRQLDICAQCHSGSTQLKDLPFAYRPGDAVMDHYDPPPPGADAANSVHTSNQLVRLSESKCFQATEMTCVDCHNPHQNERGDRELFSQRCITCHDNDANQGQGCGFDPPADLRLEDNCIDCHMPSRPTEKLRLRSVEGDVFPSLRDHKVRVDDKATQEFLESNP